MPEKKSNQYFPPPESIGGWRTLSGNEEIKKIGMMDPKKLDIVIQEQEYYYNDSFSIVIIRNGYLVKEYYTFNVLLPTRFDIWSCTKTLTGTAWGLLFDDAKKGKISFEPHDISLDSYAYDCIPQGLPLTDERKKGISFRHLLTMTSGIPGESYGIHGSPTASNTGPFEHALGKTPNRYGKWVNKLQSEPGQTWDYSDPAFVHLSIAFFNITGREINDFMEERVFKPIGIENLSWDVQGGSGFLGPHTNPHTGAHISARELARFGYLALNNGLWDGNQIIPEWWHKIATKSSQSINPSYGYTWWVNTDGMRWQGLPKDMYALEGFRSNRCYIIPSLNLIVARVGTGPSTWSEIDLIAGIVNSITANPII